MKFDPAIVQTRVSSPLGTIAIAVTVKGLAGLWFTENQRYLPGELNSQSGSAYWPEDAGHTVLQETRLQLADYFAGKRRSFELPLDLSSGTAFQQSVWQALLQIPPGDTQSYGDVSRHIGQPGAVRAVGAAIGRNPISIIVPCHRVMGANGALTGYAGGLERKSALLRLEGALEEMLL